MQVNDLMYVGKSESEAFGIMDIACMHTIELIKYLLQVLLLDAETSVPY